MFASVLDRLSYRYPSVLVDGVLSHEPGVRMVAVKNVTVNEEFFQGHFPGTPLMPGVLLIESLAQVATLLLADTLPGRGDRVALRSVDDVKFRKQVVPGDRLELDVKLGARRGPLVRAEAIATNKGQVVAEARLLLVVEPEVVVPEADIHPTAVIHPGAVIGEGTVVGPYAIIGPRVTVGNHCRIGASTVIDGWTDIGDHTEIFPLASIGLAPQDLKFKGEPTRLTIGTNNVFREFVTIHRGTAGGGGVTTIGDHNLFMAYAHVAHDCHVGNHTIFGNGATLGGHVTVDDWVTISAFSGVHQFCRIGKFAFIGGYTVVTRNALPYAKTVGNRARIYGLNSIGLERRGFSRELIGKLRRAYRHLIQHNTSRAIELIEGDPTLAAPEVAFLVEFIRHAGSRGVILRRPSRRAGDETGGE
ncbi:MAG: acyl-ACP--UDP-N-acetylglucosamine O-acyltransferase [Acidobacteria bacterium]|jgi:UDP-N-acetylglucosamine acyltransferase|nr:acyl-ACP--UDP-N-acetylglucosamine O-acyltransferase [Acidobacteriota bacterium]